MHFDPDKLVRENVKLLTPYSSARSEFNAEARIFLDANENSLGAPVIAGYSRYPDPLQTKLKEQFAALISVEADQIFVGNGSDEAIDLLFRVFCQPRVDNVVICPPTYRMYQVAAGINDVLVKRATLTSDFQLDVCKILDLIDARTKLLFVCSPNNPTGNSIKRESILRIAESFDGIVVIDEAYIHFSGSPSLIDEIENYPNLVILQTFSKAWGLAGLRVGVAVADRNIIRLLNKVKPPYNVSEVSQNMICEALRMKARVDENVAEIIEERAELAQCLARLASVKKVYPSEANFLLVKVADPKAIYRFLLDNDIVVRNWGSDDLCEGCLRITVGTSTENNALLAALETYETSVVYRP